MEVQTPAKERIADLRAKASTFVLMTNILAEQELSATDILTEYKEQTAVEVRFRLLKAPTLLPKHLFNNQIRRLLCLAEFD